ncbi:polysaccharide pyruvyl transferase family protein [Agrilactobacillus yilanensis]|uniref:Polysaccharide pyruvyl transferase family protein n=1 Tax=Agrilactobacillus yilanensis TaxID=2485997 RepID=A0ABW4J7S2_9LACO|nr:polysaccharide pyruvyl transferase family protein [Agrilactobacillus yilanensis]
MAMSFKSWLGAQLKPQQKLWLDYYRPSRRRFSATANRKIFILQSARHSPNLGDFAIAFEQRQWLAHHCPAYELEELYTDGQPADYRQMARVLTPKDILVFQGGGNLGDLWPHWEYERQFIVQKFPKNPIVILPQSAYFSETPQGERLLRRAQRIYNQHPNLTMAARDRTSYNFLKTKFGLSNVLLTPDIVLADHQLKASVAQAKLQRQSGKVTLALRQDKEKRLTANLEVELANSPDLTVTKLDTVLTNYQPAQFQGALQQLLWCFAQSELVITDRLHGLIFCYLTQTPCLFLDNLDYKLKHLYETWLQPCTFIQPTTVETLHEDIANLRQQGPTKQVLDFTADFRPLQQTFQTLMAL